MNIMQSIAKNNITCGAGSEDSERRVFFSDCTKPHDGLCPESKLFESVIKEYFVSRTVTDLEGIYAILKTKSDFEIVLRMFDNFIESMEHCTKTTVPVLPEGGGLALKIELQHIRYVLILKNFVEKAYHKFLETYVPIPEDMIME